MKFRVELSANDLNAAVEQWLRDQGMRLVGKVTVNAPGPADPPYVLPEQATATCEAEPIKGDPQR